MAAGVGDARRAGAKARAARLLRRRPGPLGLLLIVPTYLLLGIALVVYVVGMLALAFAAVLVHTVRLLLGPPIGALRRVAGSA